MDNIGIIVIVISLVLFASSLAVAALIAAKHASEKEYRCLNCKKLFHPRMRDSFGAAYSFGHKSVLVRCPHCRHKARVLPVDEQVSH